jgi:predicted HicB family RNase H-like nuclease
MAALNMLWRNMDSHIVWGNSLPLKAHGGWMTTSTILGGQIRSFGPDVAQDLLEASVRAMETRPVAAEKVEGDMPETATAERALRPSPSRLMMQPKERKPPMPVLRRKLPEEDKSRARRRCARRLPQGMLTWWPDASGPTRLGTWYGRLTGEGGFERCPRCLSPSASAKGDGQGGGEVGSAVSHGSGGNAMNVMTYKGYEALVQYDEDAEIFHGEVMNLRDVITFQGSSVKELKKAFADSVEDYLAFCKERGEEPEKPYSGQFIVRVDPRSIRRWSWPPNAPE